MTGTHCLFCRIVAGEVPSMTVHADETAVAFLDIAPWQAGHTLVVPRRHVVDVLAGPDVLAEVSAAVTVVGALLKEKLGATACNVLSNAGPDSGQEVMHAHVHVIPRYPDSPGITAMRAPVTSDPSEVHQRLTS